MRVLLGDPPMDWSKITSSEQLRAFASQRDTHAEEVVKKNVLDKGRRALLCYGWSHLAHGGSLAGLIQRKTGQRVYTIVDLVPLAGDPGELAKKLEPYPQDCVIPTAGTWLGDFDAGLMPPSLQGGPNNPTNPWCGTKLRQFIDAGLYVGQPDQLTTSWPNPAIYLDAVYWKELERRNAILQYPVDLSSYRQEHPAPYALQTLPPSQECGASHG